MIAITQWKIFTEWKIEIAMLIKAALSVQIV